MAGSVLVDHDICPSFTIHGIGIGMPQPIEAHQTADQILVLERSALDRWGSGDPGGSLDLYDADVSYFDPGTAPEVVRRRVIKLRGGAGP